VVPLLYIIPQCCAALRFFSAYAIPAMAPPATAAVALL